MDPRDWIERATHPNNDRKAMQLCRQIERTLSLVISGELDDDRLRDLVMMSVVPAPHSNHLLVTLQSINLLTDRELIELDAILFSYKGRLRTSVGEVISRRKVPDLSFRVINPPS